MTPPKCPGNVVDSIRKAISGGERGKRKGSLHDIRYFDHSCGVREFPGWKGGRVGQRSHDIILSSVKLRKDHDLLRPSLSQGRESISASL
jgi:hypothetical protein